MIRKFLEGQRVYFATSVEARNMADPHASKIIVNKGAHGLVNSYSKEGTEEVETDDFVGIQITEGDEAKGKTVWVSFADFGKLTKIH